MSHESRIGHQAIEPIVRRAEGMGLDPQRVVRALDQAAIPLAERQAEERLETQSRFGRRFARPS